MVSAPSAFTSSCGNSARSARQWAASSAKWSESAISAAMRKAECIWARSKFVMSRNHAEAALSPYSGLELRRKRRRPHSSTQDICSRKCATSRAKG